MCLPVSLPFYGMKFYPDRREEAQTSQQLVTLTIPHVEPTPSSARILTGKYS